MTGESAIATAASRVKGPRAPDHTARADRVRLEVYGGLLTLFCLALLLALATSDRADLAVGIGGGATGNFLGPVGAHMADFFLWGFGLGALLVDGLLATIGVRALMRRPVRLSAGTVTWAVVGVLCVGILLQLAFRGARPLGYPPAGRLGLYAGELAAALLSDGGAALVAGSTLAIAIAYLSGGSLATVLRLAGRGIAWTARRAWLAIRAGALAFAAWAAGLFRRRALDPAAPDADPFARPATTPTAHAGDGPLIRDTQIDRPRVFEEAASEPAAATRVRDSEVRPWTWAGEGLDALGDGDASGAVTPGPATATTGPRIVVTPQRAPSVQEALPLPKADPRDFQPPPLSLLDCVEARAAVIDRDFLRRNAETLERKLLDYKVEGKVVEIHPGPVVTMYEFLPAPGVKISQIANLSDDLTMALEAVSIRIVAPIPGKGVVGIEVPNAIRETVYLREILASESFAKAKSKMTLALGKDIFGTPVATDLAKMPHLLIAGATGSGKSVAVNAFILSLLYNATPEEVRIILVDPKVVELQVYEGIPHLLLPVVYDPKHAAAALRWAVDEMERRYELLARFGTRNLQSFNQRVDRLLGRHADSPAGSDAHDTAIVPAESTTSTDTDGEELKKLPYIVIVLDEFADLMMVASKEVETAVARLAQKARAAGIHLVMATQRPSKEVITGLIKANFPSRIGFRVSSKIDSRIILDQSGADALLGNGDMLFLRPGSSLVTRVHGPFVSDDEVARVTAHLKAQGTPDYQMEILQNTDEVQEEDEKDLDPMLPEAQDIVLESRRASISFLQRKLKIGYNRSARIMEQLERRAIVGPPDSKGERQVLA